MTAAVECAVCGGKLLFDTRNPITPENMGWMEIPVCEVSIMALMEQRAETTPICPRCLERHARMIRDYDPFKKSGRKGARE